MNKTESYRQARELLLQNYQGILCTNSRDMPGYPFGSVVPYILDKRGQPVILISTIAQHTRNIVVNNKVSLIVTEGEADDLQTVGRVTCVGDAHKLEEMEQDAMDRYYEYFPQSRDYHKTHDFDFYTIAVSRVRYIGGFGDIHWIEPNQFLLENPFSFKQEQGMTSHMNSDHADAVRHYCDLFDIPLAQDQQPVLVGIDSEGFHLRNGRRIYRIRFDQPVTDATEVRSALVEMARRE